MGGGGGGGGGGVVVGVGVGAQSTDLGVLRGRARQLGPARVGAQDVLQVLVPRLQLCTTQRAHPGGVGGRQVGARPGGVGGRQVEPLGRHVSSGGSARCTDAGPHRTADLQGGAEPEGKGRGEEGPMGLVGGKLSSALFTFLLYLRRW